MDDIEFKPYDTDNLKRIGSKNDADGNQDENRPFNKNSYKPKNYTIIILLIIATVAIFSYNYYQNTVIHPKQTKAELLEIRSALYHYKESFGTYPNQLTELAKGRPLREGWSTDAWDNPYLYEVDESKQSFKVTSAGRDGAFGNKDDIQVK